MSSDGEFPKNIKMKALGLLSGLWVLIRLFIFKDKEFAENGDNETFCALRNNGYINTILRKEKYYGSSK